MFRGLAAKLTMDNKQRLMLSDGAFRGRRKEVCFLILDFKLQILWRFGRIIARPHRAFCEGKKLGSKLNFGFVCLVRDEIICDVSDAKGHGVGVGGSPAKKNIQTVGRLFCLKIKTLLHSDLFSRSAKHDLSLNQLFSCFLVYTQEKTLISRVLALILN